MTCILYVYYKIPWIYYIVARYPSNSHSGYSDGEALEKDLSGKKCHRQCRGELMLIVTCMRSVPFEAVNNVFH